MPAQAAVHGQLDRQPREILRPGRHVSGRVEHGEPDRLGGLDDLRHQLLQAQPTAGVHGGDLVDELRGQVQLVGKRRFPAEPRRRLVEDPAEDLERLGRGGDDRLGPGPHPQPQEGQLPHPLRILPGAVVDQDAISEELVRVFDMQVIDRKADRQPFYAGDDRLPRILASTAQVRGSRALKGFPQTTQGLGGRTFRPFFGLAFLCLTMRPVLR